MVPSAARQYIDADVSERLAEVVRKLLDRVPGSDRELARAADVPPSTLSRIRSRTRGCTPEVARALADVLADWREDCVEAEATLRRHLEEEANGE